ncbi:MAG: R3H domain-containing nucleic acid-binding protein [Terracoccus sp.]
MSDTQETETMTTTDAVEPSVDAVDSTGPKTTDESSPEESAEAPEAVTEPVTEESVADEQEAGEDDDAVETRSGKGSRVRQLEREGEVAADFLETLLDIADLDGDIDVDVDGDRAAIAIVDSDEGRVPRRLVGPDGRVLEALQELTRLAVQAETGERSRLMLDVAGHRAERRAALVTLAAAAISEVKDSGTKQALDPMSAFERKVVHDEVAAAGLSSESEGVEPHRHIVILPA